MKRKPPRRPPENASYEIGYCKPPTHSRFKPGQCGCPSGRRGGRRKAPKSLGDALNNALAAKVTLRTNGKESDVSAKDAFILRLVRDAIQGKASAQKMLLDLMNRFRPENPDVASDGNAKDSVAELMKQIDLMGERLKKKPPDEK
jgi:hypothetical protein